MVTFGIIGDRAVRKYLPIVDQIAEFQTVGVCARARVFDSETEGLFGEKYPWYTASYKRICNEVNIDRVIIGNEDFDQTTILQIVQYGLSCNKKILLDFGYDLQELMEGPKLKGELLINIEHDFERLYSKEFFEPQPFRHNCESNIQIGIVYETHRGAMDLQQAIMKCCLYLNKSLPGIDINPLHIKALKREQNDAGTTIKLIINIRYNINIALTLKTGNNHQYTFVYQNNLGNYIENQLQDNVENFKNLNYKKTLDLSISENQKILKTTKLFTDLFE